MVSAMARKCSCQQRSTSQITGQGPGERQMTTQFGMLNVLTNGAISASFDAGHNAGVDDVLLAITIAGYDISGLPEEGDAKVNTLTTEADKLDESAEAKEQAAARLLSEADVEHGDAAAKRAHADFVAQLFQRIKMAKK